MASRNDLNMVVTAYEDGTLTKLSDLGQKLETSTGAQTLDEWFPGSARPSMTRPRRRASSALPIRQASSSSSPARRTGHPARGCQSSACRWRPDARRQDARHRLGHWTSIGLPAGDEARWRGSADVGFLHSTGDPHPGRVQEGRDTVHLRDGHTARYLVQTALDPFSTAAMDQVQEIIKTAETAKPNTTLANAKVSMVGFSVAQRDIRNYYNGDVQWIMIVTLIVVSSSWCCCCARWWHPSTWLPR